MTTRLLLLMLVACKRDDDGALGRLPDAQVTIVSEGAGPENDAPLEPARAGTWSAKADTWQRWIGVMDAGRDDVVTKEVSGGNQPLAPTLGQGVGVYRFTDDGLVLHALDTPLDDETLPILMVPETVRLGMSWESEYGDGESVNRMEVVRHQDVMLPTGPASVWAIAEYGEDVNGLYVALTRWYAEGIGRVGTSRTEAEWSPEFGYTEMVVPEDEQAHDEPPFAPAALVNVIPIEAHGENGHEIWGLSGAVIDGTLYAYMDGLDPAIGFTLATPHDYCASLASTPRWVDAGLPGCPTRTIVVQDPFTQLYSEATVLLDSAAMILPGVETTLDLTAVGGVADEELTGWVVDGVVETLNYEQHGLPPAQFFRYRHDGAPPTLTALADATSTRTLFLHGAQDDGIGTSSYWSSLMGQVWIGPAIAAADVPLHFAVVARDGRVFRVSLVDETLTGFVPVGVLPGAISILLDGDERIAYSITTDGRVFELRVDQATGEVTIDGLGAVRVEEPGGAYEFKGVLMDPTHPGDVYVAAIATSATSVPFYETGLFKAHLETDPEPLVSAGSFSIGGAMMDAGLTVCWAPSDEPLQTSGWTLRGEPVDVRGPVGPDGNCAFVNWDVTVPATAEWAGALRAIEADVPGAGAVRLGLSDLTAGYSLDTMVAVRPDGTLFDARGLVLDSDGFPVSRLYTGRWSGSSLIAWARDLSGQGLWTWSSSTSVGVPLDLHNLGGGGGQAPPCPDTGSLYECSYGGTVVDGGVMLLAPSGTSPAQILVVRPDGTVEHAPVAQAGAAYPFASRIRLANGRICGLTGNPSRVDCVDPDGTVATTGPLTEGLAAAGRGPFWPLPGGTLLLPAAPSLRIDPSTMGFTELDPRFMSVPVTSTDGHVYAIARGLDADFGYTYEVVEITPTGVVDLMPASESSVVVPLDGALLVYGRPDAHEGNGWSWVAR